MKIKLYDEPTPAKEREITLRLIRQAGTGKAMVCIVDEKGETVPCGLLIVFGRDMVLERKGRIDTSLGLPLDKNGRLIADDDR